MSPMLDTRAAPNELVLVIEKTYRVLRSGLGGAALALPPLLYVGGLFGGVPLQASLSAYYHTHMRDVFVGVLFAAGAALVFYRGFSRQENYALNFAGAFAALVALIPTPATGRFSLHGTCAVLFFVGLAYVAIVRPNDTLTLLKDATRANRYRRTYRLLGGAMGLLPLVAAVVISIWPYPDGAIRPVVFFVEAGAIYAFGLFWIVKSREIREIQSQPEPFARAV